MYRDLSFLSILGICPLINSLLFGRYWNSSLPASGVFETPLVNI